MQATVAAIFAVGHELKAAKAALHHGEFERLFKDHPDCVEHPIQFGIRTGQRLIAIAEHPVLSNTTHVSLLPSSWGTLYQLTKVGDTQLIEALASGVIHPDMARKDVKALHPPSLKTTELLEFNETTEGDKFTDYIIATYERWPPEHRVWLLWLFNRDMNTLRSRQKKEAKENITSTDSPHTEAI
jgi:hypothetical protein